MELNNFQLNATLVAELYRDTLVDMVPAAGSPATKKEIKPKEALPENAAARYLGENGKHILVLVNEPQAVFLPDEQLSFLTTILGACKLNLGDIALVNFQHAPQQNLKALLSQFQPRVVLFFGLTPAELDLPISFPEYQVQPHGGATLLYGPSLGQLAGDKVQKSKLWVALRRLFAL